MGHSLRVPEWKPEETVGQHSQAALAMTGRDQIIALAQRVQSFTVKVARENYSGTPQSVPPLLNLLVREGHLTRVGYGQYAAPERAEEAREHGTDGPVAQAILRALSKKPNLQMVELKRAAHAHSGGETVEAVVSIMYGAGLVSRTTRGYALTSKGARRIPSAPPVMPAITPYRHPVAPPRRPGSMAFLAAPSVFAEGPR